MQLSSKLQKGFTLVELIIVIAIIGVLAAVLITIIDPLDKINSANDAGVISTATQIGRSLDTYATTHNNSFIQAGDIDSVLAALSTTGESKISTYTPPSAYDISYYTAPVGCTSAAQDCTGYAVVVEGLQSKRYTGASTPNFQVVNGRSCVVTAANTITQADLTASPTNPAHSCP